MVRMVAFCALLFPSLVLAAKVPDIPMGSKFYIESKSQSDESARFALLLASKLSKDEGNRRYEKPGLPVVDRREDAAYVLRFLLVVRESARTSVFDSSRGTHALVNAWLLDASGKELWSDQLDCTLLLTGEAVSNCASLVAQSIKGAQVNDKGKRAGLLGWRIK